MSKTNHDVRADELNADYHADHAYISHSMLETFMKSPSLFEGRYVTGGIKHDETPAMRRGSLVHCLVLEPETFGDQYRIIECADRRSKKWKDGRFEAEEQGFIAVTEPEWLESEIISRRVLNHPLTSRILEACNPSLREHSVRWEVEGTKKKARIDLYCPHVEQLGGPVIIDLKTAADPSPYKFKWAARDFGYDRQAAWYCDAACAAWGVDPMFLFMVVGSSEPHDVYVYEMSIDRIMAAREDNAEAANKLINAIETNDFMREDEMKIDLHTFGPFNEEEKAE